MFLSTKKQWQKLTSSHWPRQTKPPLAKRQRLSKSTLLWKKQRPLAKTSLAMTMRNHLSAAGLGARRTLSRASLALQRLLSHHPVNLQQNLLKWLLKRLKLMKEWLSECASLILKRLLKSL
jgi:hypothetical protein